MMTDAAVHDNTWQSQLTDYTGPDYAGNAWVGQSLPGPMPAGGYNGGNTDHRHTGGYNILWYDGHVKWAHNSFYKTSNPAFPSGYSPYYWYVVKPANP